MYIFTVVGRQDMLKNVLKSSQDSGYNGPNITNNFGKTLNTKILQSMLILSIYKNIKFSFNFVRAMCQSQIKNIIFKMSLNKNCHSSRSKGKCHANLKFAAVLSQNFLKFLLHIQYLKMFVKYYK